MERHALNKTNVLERKLGFERRGSMKLFTHTPAVVTEVSCPSFAVLKSVRKSPLNESGESTYSYLA